MSNSDSGSRQVRRFFWLVSFFLGVSLGAKFSVSLILRLDRIREIPLISRAWDGVDKACDAISFLLFLAWVVLIVLMLIYAVVPEKKKAHHERNSYNYASSDEYDNYVSSDRHDRYSSSSTHDERVSSDAHGKYAPMRYDEEDEMTFLRHSEYAVTPKKHEAIQSTVSRTSENRTTNSMKNTDESRTVNSAINAAPLQDFSQELKLIFERRRRQNSLAELKALLYN